MSKLMSLLEQEFPEMNWVDDTEAKVFRGTWRNKTYEIPYEYSMDTNKWGNMRATINQFKQNA